MSKIYEGDTKLNVAQVCDKLGREINQEQASILMKHSNGETGKSAFAHMVLDAYKHLPNTTEHDMLIRKLCKHLMEKYMKSTAETTEVEITAFKTLMENIVEKSNKVS